MVADTSVTTVAVGHDAVIDAATVAALPRLELEPGHAGVSFTRVWEKDGSYAGVMWVGPGQHVPAHTHRQRAHHVWVAEGRCLVQGRDLGRGSYWHVPAGERHSLQGAEPEGCTLFFLYAGE